MSIVISILTVLVMLGILSAAHELGHFFVSRLLKVKAYEVSIFVGPTLFKWRKKEVDYTIRCVPLGAYVRFNEVDNEGNAVVSDDPELLVNQPRWKRLLIALAGPAVNLLLGILIFIIFYSFAGYTDLKAGVADEGSQLYGKSYEVGDTVVALDGYRVYTADELNIFYSFRDAGLETKVTFKSAKTGEEYDVTLNPVVKRQALLGIYRNTTPDPTYNGWYITQVDERQNDNDPVIQTGDVIVSVDGIDVNEEDKIFPYLDERSEGDVATVVYYRDGVEHTDEIKMFAIDTVNETGFVFTEHKVQSVGEFFGAVGTAFKMPISIVRMTGLVIKNFISGDVKAYQVLSGPVGVVNVVDTVVADEYLDTGLKVSTLVMISGMISVALTISNLLPLPGLDGSQLIIIIVELVSGRKLSQKVENVISVVGFFVLIFLVIAAFASDIVRIFVEGW